MGMFTIPLTLPPKSLSVPEERPTSPVPRNSPSCGLWVPCFIGGKAEAFRPAILRRTAYPEGLAALRIGPDRTDRDPA